MSALRTSHPQNVFSLRQLRPLRIANDVLQAILPMLFVPDHAIPILLFPKSARLSQAFIDFARRESFPRLQQCFQAKALPEAKERVHVIGHYDERRHIAALAIEEQQSVRDDLAQSRITQDTGSFAGIEPVFDLLDEAPMVLRLGVGIP